MMKTARFEQQLKYILKWWEPFVDWENGGIATFIQQTKQEVGSNLRIPLMHLRQIYNYSVGVEQGISGCEDIAKHLYKSLFKVFPDRKGNLMVSEFNRHERETNIASYLNAYQAICLSRYARTFKDREAAELSLKVYQEMDAFFTDKDLSERGTWDLFNPETKEFQGKSDNAHIHRCEAALHVYRALEVAAPDLFASSKEYLQSQLRILTHFFDRYISRPEAGLTVEQLEDDCSPHRNFNFRQQSLAHGFEWLGFCQEIEAYCDITLPFIEDRMRTLCTRTLENGLAANGCFRNDFYPGLKSAPMQANFWPQVEAILGVLWARKRWGEEAFPVERAERMMWFYETYFFKPAELGGGIMSGVSENGCPINYSSGHAHKCDHHAVRMVEKILEFDLLGDVPK